MGSFSSAEQLQCVKFYHPAGGMAELATRTSHREKQNECLESKSAKTYIFEMIVYVCRHILSLVVFSTVND